MLKLSFVLSCLVLSCLVFLKVDWGHLGSFWKSFGVIFGCLGGHFGHLKRSWGHLGRSWGPLGRSWGRLTAPRGGSINLAPDKIPKKDRLGTPKRSQDGVQDE